MTDRPRTWKLYVCDKGHVDTRTLDGVCWACYPGGRRTWEPGQPRQTEPNEVLIPAVEWDRSKVVPIIKRAMRASYDNAEWTIDTQHDVPFDALAEAVFDALGGDNE